MKRIQVDIIKDSVGTQVFDRYYAWRQSQNRHDNYHSDVRIEFGKPRSGCINVAYAYMPDDWVNPHDYDFIFYENCSEGLEVATEEIRGGVIQPMGYFLCGAYTSAKQRFHGDIIPWSLCHSLFVDRHVRPFNPGFYDRTTAVPRTKNLWYINGQRRAHRQLLLEKVLSLTPHLEVHDSINKEVWPLDQSFFESDEDTKLRLYVHSDYTPNETLDYYSSAVPIGINQKFGTIAKGWFVMPQYYEHRCTIYPESGWLNHQIQPNEKFFKCCLAGTIPFPIGGAETNLLYNQFGFKTAWNLLPSEHTDFDQCLDHIERYQQIAKAVAWLDQNPEVFESDQAQQIVDQNYTRLFEPSFDLITMQHLDRLFFQ